MIVLCKGRVLDKGRFAKLHEKGVISSAVDPLYIAALKDKTDSPEPFAWKNSEKQDDANPLPDKASSLEIAKEDRTIGVLTARLYWDYFRSGVHPLMITGMVGFSLITQGKLIVIPSYKPWVRPLKGIHPFFSIS